MRERNRPAVRAFGVCAAVFVFISTLVLVAEPSASAAVGGTQLWASSYDSRALYGGFEALSPDGSKVFVTGDGQTAGQVQTSYALLVAYDASMGATLWAARGPKTSSAASLAVSPDGSKVFVTGIGGAPWGTSYGSYFTVAYDASSGATLWTRRYNPPNSGANVATSLSVSPNGSEVFVTGFTELLPSYARRFETIAYRATNGQTLWARRYPGSPISVAVSPDGSEVFVTPRDAPRGLVGPEPDLPRGYPLGYSLPQNPTCWRWRRHGRAAHDRLRCLRETRSGNRHDQDLVGQQDQGLLHRSPQ